MPFHLNQIVPWGRSFEEYVTMFSLSGPDLQKRIMGIADGPAAFNAELTARGGDIISVDPIYQFSAMDIKTRVEEVAPTILSCVRENERDFVWKFIKSPDHLLRIRMDSMRRFLTDFEGDQERGRYIAAELPKLPFRDDEFDLALCSHFLLLYGGLLDLRFHYSALKELLRITSEVRVFPIIELGNKP